MDVIHLSFHVRKMRESNKFILCRSSMLLRFGVENHRSIRTYQELSLVATTLKDSAEGLLNTSWSLTDSNPLQVVPALAIYGSNAAGKSTVLKALDFFVQAILGSHSRGAVSGGVPYHPFLLDDVSSKKPSRYDADFMIKGIRYHYGFSLDGEKFTREWLYMFSAGGRRVTKTTLFVRDRDNPEEFYFGKSLKGENKQISKLVRPNSLYLSAAAQNSHPVLSDLYELISKKFVTRVDVDLSEFSLAKQLLAYLGDDENRTKQAIEFLAAADVGILGVDFAKIPFKNVNKDLIEDFERLFSKHFDLPEAFKEPPTRVRLLHRGANDKAFAIGLDAESAGTISLLQLIGPAFERLREGGVLVVDELNSTLHPLVSRELIRLFSNPTTNPGGAQIIFSTHDTNLLAGGLLRRDQIWFAEKDREGETCIYPLSEITVRSKDNLERGYLTGRFGAIPFFDRQAFSRLGSIPVGNE